MAWCFMWILCLAEDSHEISSLIFSEEQWKKYLWMSSAAVVIGALRVSNAGNLHTDYPDTTNTTDNSKCSWNQQAEI